MDGVQMKHDREEAERNIQRKKPEWEQNFLTKKFSK